MDKQRPMVETRVSKVRQSTPKAVPSSEAAPSTAMLSREVLGAGSVETQAAMLQQLHTAQRVEMVEQIGHTQGNRHVLRLLDEFQESEAQSEQGALPAAADSSLFAGCGPAGLSAGSDFHLGSGRRGADPAAPPAAPVSHPDSPTRPSMPARPAEKGASGAAAAPHSAPAAIRPAVSAAEPAEGAAEPESAAETESGKRMPSWVPPAPPDDGNKPNGQGGEAGEAAASEAPENPAAGEHAPAAPDGDAAERGEAPEAEADGAAVDSAAGAAGPASEEGSGGPAERKAGPDEARVTGSAQAVAAVGELFESLVPGKGERSAPAAGDSESEESSEAGTNEAGGSPSGAASESAERPAEAAETGGPESTAKPAAAEPEKGGTETAAAPTGTPAGASESASSAGAGPAGEAPAAASESASAKAPSGTEGGAAAVQQLQQGLLQTKLTVSTPGDRYEQEADRVADAVMRAPQTGTAPATRSGDFSRVARRGEGAPAVASETESQISNLQGRGQPLPDSERGFFESRMGVDLSGVRVHTGGNESGLAQTLKARAFTVGRNVVFNEGEYRPGTEGGRRLLAHELAHVVQQGEAPTLKSPQPTAAAAEPAKAAPQAAGPEADAAPQKVAPKVQRLPSISIPNPFSGLIDSLKRRASEAGNRIRSGAQAVAGTLMSRAGSAWTGLRTTAANSWNAVRTQGTAAWTTLKSGATTAWTNVRTTATTAWTQVKTQGATAWSTLKSGAAAAWSGIQSRATAAATGLRTTATTLWNGLRTGATTAVTGLGNLWNGLKTRASAAVTGLRTQATNFLQGLRNRVTTIAQGLQAGLQGLRGRATALMAQLQGMAQGLIGGIKGGLSGIAAAILKMDGQALSAAWNNVQGLAGRAWQTLQGAAGNAMQALQGVWAGLRNGATTLLSGVSQQARGFLGNLGGQAQALWSGLQGMWSGLKGTASSLLNGLKSRALAGLGSLRQMGTAAWNGLKSLGTSAWNTIKNQGTAAWNGLKNLGTSAWNGLKSLGTGAWNTIKNQGTAAWNGLKNLGTGAWNGLKNLATGAWNALRGDGDREVEGKRGEADREESGIRGLAGRVMDFLGSILSGLRSVAGPAISSLASTAGNAWKGLMSQGTGAWNNLKNLATGAWTTLKTNATGAWTNLKDLATGAWTTLKTNATGAWNNLKGMATSAWTHLKGMAGTAWNGLKATAGSIWTGVQNGWNGLKEMAGSAWSGIQGAWGSLKGFVGNAWQGLKGMAVNAWQGLQSIASTAWKGAQAGWDWIKTQAGNAVKLLMDGLNRLTGLFKNFSLSKLIQMLTQYGPFLQGIQRAIQNPGALSEPIVTAIADRLSGLPGQADAVMNEKLAGYRGATGETTTAPVQRTIMRSPDPGAGTPQRTRGSFSDLVEGVKRQLGAKLAQLMGNLPQVIKDCLWTLIWPWPGVAEDFNGMVQDIKATVDSLHTIRTDSLQSFVDDLQSVISRLADIPMIIWRTLNSMAGRLYVWFFLASVLVGAIIGAFFGGVGAIPGALAGAKFGLAVGEGLLYSFIAAEALHIVKSAEDVVLVPQTPVEREEDCAGIADSAIALGVTALIMLLMAIASRIAQAIRAFVRRIRGQANEPVKPPTSETEPPKTEPEKPPEVPVDPYADLKARFNLSDEVLQIFRQYGLDPATIERLLLQGISPEDLALYVMEYGATRGVGILELKTRFNLDPDVAVVLFDQGIDPAVLQRLLAKGVSAEDIALYALEYGSKGVAVFDGLVGKNIQPHVAADILRLGNQLNLMDDIAKLVNGNCRNLNGLRKFLRDIEAEVAQGNYGKIKELQDAAARAAQGHEVQLGKINGEGADVVDHTTQEAIQHKLVTSADEQAVVEHLNKAADQLAGNSGEMPPDGYSGVIDLQINNPRNPLFEGDRAAVGEVVRETLAGNPAVDKVIIRNDAGTFTFEGPDFP